MASITSEYMLASSQTEKEATTNRYVKLKSPILLHSQTLLQREAKPNSLLDIVSKLFRSGSTPESNDTGAL